MLQYLTVCIFELTGNFASSCSIPWFAKNENQQRIMSTGTGRSTFSCAVPKGPTYLANVHRVYSTVRTV